MPRHIPEPLPEPVEFLGDHDGLRILPVERPSGPADYRAVTTPLRGEPIEGTVSIVGPENFELTVTDELQKLMQARGFKNVRRDFEQLVVSIHADPHGVTNIDEFKDEDAGQMARLVHEVTGPLANLIPGKRLAIKSTGLNMRDTRRYLELGGPSRSLLTDQFRETLALWRKQQLYAPDGVGGVIFVNEVYGIVSYTDNKGQRQEWMLMEYISGAESVENKQIVSSRGGIAMGFDVEKYPELAQLAGFDPRLDNQFMMFSSLRIVVEHALHERSAIKDLNGNNILEQRDQSGKPRYTLIDIASF